MHTATMTKKKEKGCTFIIEAPKRANFLPIQVQISLKAQSRRHDKSRNRSKSKQWKKEQG